MSCQINVDIWNQIFDANGRQKQNQLTPKSLEYIKKIKQDPNNSPSPEKKKINEKNCKIIQYVSSTLQGIRTSD